MKMLARLAAILAICGICGEALLTVAGKIRDVWGKFKSDFPDEEPKVTNPANDKNTENVEYQEIR